MIGSSERGICGGSNETRQYEIDIHPEDLAMIAVEKNFIPNRKSNIVFLNAWMEPERSNRLIKFWQRSYVAWENTRVPGGVLFTMKRVILWITDLSAPSIYCVSAKM